MNIDLCESILYNGAFNFNELYIKLFKFSWFYS